jgi:hypothetical protein
MDPIQAQALLIRHEAAMKLVEHTDQSGRLGLLTEIIWPSDNLLKSSLKEAQRRGASELARILCGKTKAAPNKSLRKINWASR